MNELAAKECVPCKGGVPPLEGMSIGGCPSPGLNQISLPSPENPSFRTMNPLDASGGMSEVRLENTPVPTRVCQMSNLPLRSARKATNSPSGEISAPSSVPSQFTRSVN